MVAAPRQGAWLLLAGALALAPAQAEWLSPQLTEHPLAGQVWDSAARAFTTPEQVYARAAEAQYVLLGEVHVNPDHHRLQAEVLQALLGEWETRHAVVFEMFDRGQQPLIDEAVGDGGDAARVIEATGLARRGWQPEFYAPLVDLTLAAGRPLVAGNLSRAEAREVAFDGLDAVLTPAEQERLGLSTPLPDLAHEALLDLIDVGHCGYLSRDMLVPMMTAQRVRDAVLADAMLAHPRAGLIAGGVHARRDLGVPIYLAGRRPQAEVVSIGFVEVRSGREAPRAYYRDGADFDYLWFTARTEAEDPCAALDDGVRERLRGD
jgi:uncharacterized iron-regulated protein